MDSFTFNKIAGAVLGTCLVGMGLGIVGQAIYVPEAPSKPGYALPEPKEGAATDAKKAPDVPLPVLLAKADEKKGETAAKVCSACHNFAEGAGAKVGPDLYGVVGRPKGSAPGFDYSAGLKGKGGDWTLADLNEFITKPSAYISGTKMGYPGEENPEKRADILMYLRSLSKTPVALPPVTDADKKASAGGDAKPGDTKTASAADAGKTADAGKPAEGGDADLIKMIAAADPKKGQSDAQVCGACHNLKEGGGAIVGPPLWGVVDRAKGSIAGFDYSAGLKAKGGKWTYADLNQFLIKPSAYVTGTKMGYPGEANPKKRAEIIAYLRTLATTPAPLEAGADSPKAEPAATKAEPPAAKPAPVAPPAPPPPTAPAEQPAPPPAAPAAAPPAPAVEAPAAPSLSQPSDEAGDPKGPQPYAAPNFEEAK